MRRSSVSFLQAVEATKEERHAKVSQWVCLGWLADCWWVWGWVMEASEVMGVYSATPKSSMWIPFSMTSTSSSSWATPIINGNLHIYHSSMKWQILSTNLKRPTFVQVFFFKPHGIAEAPEIKWLNMIEPMTFWGIDWINVSTFASVGEGLAKELMSSLESFSGGLFPLGFHEMVNKWVSVHCHV